MLWYICVVVYLCCGISVLWYTLWEHPARGGQHTVWSDEKDSGHRAQLRAKYVHCIMLVHLCCGISVLWYICVVVYLCCGISVLWYTLREHPARGGQHPVWSDEENSGRWAQLRAKYVHCIMLWYICVVVYLCCGISVLWYTLREHPAWGGQHPVWSDEENSGRRAQLRAKYDTWAHIVLIFYISIVGYARNM